MPTVNTALRFLSGPSVQGLKDVDAAAGRTTRALGGVTRMFAALGLGFSAAAVVRQIVSVSSEFEQLRAQLKTATGDIETAGKAFKFLSRFATETPFALTEVTEAFIGLQNRGFAPTEKSLRAIGNLAAAQGKSILQASQAITQAAFGEAEMLKQFGIVMTQQGDLVRIRFRGMTEELKKDSDEIFNALTRIAEGNFGTGMADQMNTFRGAVSNLRDSWEQLLDEIGNGSGFMQNVLTKAVRAITFSIEQLRHGLKNFGKEFEILIASTLMRSVDLWIQLFNKIPTFGPWAKKARQELEEFSAALQKHILGLMVEIRDAGDDTFDPLAGSAERAVPALAGVEKKLLEIRRHLENPFSFSPTPMETLISDARKRWDDFLNAEQGIDLDGFGDKVQRASTEALLESLGLFEEAAGRVQLGALNGDPTAARRFAETFAHRMREHAIVIGADLAQGFIDAVITGNLKSFFDDLGRRLGQQIAKALSDAAIGGIADSLFSGSKFAGAKATGVFAFGLAMAVGFASTLERVFGGPGGVVPGFQAVADSQGKSVQIFRNAVFTFEDAAMMIAEVQRNIRNDLNSLFGPVGGFALDPNAAPSVLGPGTGGAGGGGGAGGRGGGQDPFAFNEMLRIRLALPGILQGIAAEFGIFIQELAGEFSVSIPGIATGFGETLEEATRAMLDAFARAVPGMIERGQLVLEHVPDALIEVLKHSGAQTFEELKDALEVATEVFLVSLDKIGADIFVKFNEFGAKLQEAIRVGLPLDVAKDAFQNFFKDFLSGIAGVDLFPQFADVEAVLDQIAEQLQRFGLSAREMAAALRDAEKAVNLYNRALEQDVLGPLAAMARDFGLAAEFVREVEIARVKLELALIKIRLQEAGLWEKLQHVWREVRQHALAAAKHVTDITRGGAGRAATPARPIPVDVVKSIPIDTKPPKPIFEDALATFRDGLKAWRERFVQVARDPLEQLVFEFQDIIALVNRIFDERRRSIARGEARQAFLQAWALTVEELKKPLRDFIDTFGLSQFASGTPRQQAGLAAQSVMGLVSKALGGDAGALQAILPALQQALSLGQQAFGGATAEWFAFRDALMAAAQRALGTQLQPPPVLDEQLSAIRESTLVAMDHLQESKRQTLLLVRMDQSLDKMARHQRWVQ